MDPLASAQEWLADRGDHAVVVPHGDPDGLAAGAILARAASGGVLHVETPWEGALPADAPAVVADWGVRRVSGGSEVLFVDHHAEPEDVDGLVLHADDTGDACTSMLAWRLLNAPPDLAWLAALGAIGDLGKAALGRDDVPRVAPQAPLARLAVMVSAAGRLRGGPVAEAFDLLAGSPDAGAALKQPEAAALEEARVEVEAHRRAGMRIGPKVGSRAALVMLDLPARVHSQVAAAWTRRLAPRIVVVANAGWREGRVSFSVRSAEQIDLRAWLREIYSPPPDSGDYGRGHARATGGSLVSAAFEEFAEAVLA
jgi:single-stranded-DNA-specific exonuclease